MARVRYATFELYLMTNDGNKFQPIFQIQHIKNAWFLLELDMALVTTIEMRFAQVWSLFSNPIVYDKKINKQEL